MENYYSIEFRLEREKRYLLKNSFQAITLALNYLEDFLNLARELKALERKLKCAIAENQRLTSQLIEISSDHSNVKNITLIKRSISHLRVRIPYFLNCHKH